MYTRCTARKDHPEIDRSILMSKVNVRRGTSVSWRKYGVESGSLASNRCMHHDHHANVCMHACMHCTMCFYCDFATDCIVTQKFFLQRWLFI